MKLKYENWINNISLIPMIGNLTINWQYMPNVHRGYQTLGYLVICSRGKNASTEALLEKLAIYETMLSRQLERNAHLNLMGGDPQDTLIVYGVGYGTGGSSLTVLDTLMQAPCLIEVWPVVRFDGEEELTLIVSEANIWQKLELRYHIERKRIPAVVRKKFFVTEVISPERNYTSIRVYNPAQTGMYTDGAVRYLVRGLPHAFPIPAVALGQELQFDGRGEEDFMIEVAPEYRAFYQIGPDGGGR